MIVPKVYINIAIICAKFAPIKNQTPDLDEIFQQNVDVSPPVFWEAEPHIAKRQKTGQIADTVRGRHILLRHQQVRQVPMGQWEISFMDSVAVGLLILLMEEIPNNHLGCIELCKEYVNNGMNYQPQLVQDC